AGEGAAQAIGDDERSVEVAPDPTGHLPTVVADLVLADLLVEHDPAWVLARPQRPAVLDPTVELADGALLSPAEVAAGDLASVRVAQLHLKVWSRETQSLQQHAAAALTHALAPPVGEGDDASGAADAGYRSEAIEAVGQ